MEAAGLRDGMRVLDLGSGAGDMSFVVADIVGDSGEVVGIDAAPEAVAEATARAERLGRANVRFFLRDIHHAVDEGAFDAVVCRLVLMWVPDPAAVLRTQAAAVRQPRGRADTRCPTPTALLDKPIVACPPRPGFP
jgi:ubiquinone/menaquinone biosynthesis C-methylase UbiE